MRGELILWAVLALLLIAAETAAPGVLLLWLGLAAAAMFVLVLLVPGLDPLWQAVAFTLLSFVSVGVYWRFFRKAERASDQPLLNRRSAQLVGQVYPLDRAIVDGRGRIKVGDAVWPVEGEDLPQGTRVRVVAVDGMSLRVVPAA